MKYPWLMSDPMQNQLFCSGFLIYPFAHYVPKVREAGQVNCAVEHSFFPQVFPILLGEDRNISWNPLYAKHVL